jgi:hypothetical protein
VAVCAGNMFVLIVILGEKVGSFYIYLTSCKPSGSNFPVIRELCRSLSEPAAQVITLVEHCHEIFIKHIFFVFRVNHRQFNVSLPLTRGETSISSALL